MGVYGSKLFGRKGRGQPAGTSDLPYPQLPAHAESRRALVTLAAVSLAAIAAPSVQIAHWPSQHPAVEKLHSGLMTEGKDSAKVHALQALVYVQPRPAPTTVDTAVSAVRDLLEAVRNASDMYAPLKNALDLLMKVWDVYDRTVEVRDDFIELASQMTALNTVVVHYNKPGDTKLQERLEAIAIAVNQLSDTMQVKQDTRALDLASQSMGGVMIAKIMFCRVTSLLKVFQFEPRISLETLLVTILERLDMPGQHNLTSVDAVQVIVAHMSQQHTSTFERYQAIIDQLERCEPVGDNETVINNNSNQNERDGPTDLENNNTNETELEVEGRGGGIVNNNSNVNRVMGGGASSPGSLGGTGGPLPRTRITNNNGNKNVVRRTGGAQKAAPSRAVVL